MLQNAYLLAKIGADTAENEQHFTEILPKNGRPNRGGSGGRSSLTEVPHGAEVLVDADPLVRRDHAVRVAEVPAGLGVRVSKIRKLEKLAKF